MGFGDKAGEQADGEIHGSLLYGVPSGGAQGNIALPGPFYLNYPALPSHRSRGVACTPLDACHSAGSCDPATGVCDNPPAPDATACDDGDSCTQLDACKNGMCEGGDPILCDTADECHDVGTCNPKTGTCDNPAKPDGTPCSEGTCNAGSCIPKPDGGGVGGGEGSSSSSGAGATSGDSVDQGGCSCGVIGAPTPGGLWAGLGLLLAACLRARLGSTSAHAEYRSGKRRLNHFRRGRSTLRASATALSARGCASSRSSARWTSTIIRTLKRWRSGSFFARLSGR